ncbi:MAG: hypothetical protein KC620_18565, partial [Myxococcales bacterium]|nr:hypothetical protein [Myxococcales bacterium]
AAIQAERTAATESAAQARVLALAERVEAAVTAQASRLAAFEARLAEAGHATSTALSSTFADQTGALATRLDDTAQAVHGAAELLRGGGAELAAVAEMFAEAVDGYRDSNERWLSTLGEIEAALHRTGPEQTGRMMGEYLDQTREVFGDALRFQRELFRELRALRGEPAAGSGAALEG